MSATNWSAFNDPLTVSKRAAGRNRYNRRRQREALLRRWKCSQWLEEVGYPLRRGWQSELARRTGVSRATICRDFQLVTDALLRGTSVEQEEYYRRLTGKLNRRKSRAKVRPCDVKEESPVDTLFKQFVTGHHRATLVDENPNC